MTSPTHGSPIPPEAPKSQVRYNAERDPTYRPYCMRCDGLVRMQIVEPFYWRCACGAEHDERASPPVGGATREPTPTSEPHRVGIVEYLCVHKLSEAPAATTLQAEWWRKAAHELAARVSQLEATVAEVVGVREAICWCVRDAMDATISEERGQAILDVLAGLGAAERPEADAVDFSRSTTSQSVAGEALTPPPSGSVAP